ncbi:sensory histidine kinase DcuS [Bacillus cereus VD118]|uniref:histidine kinase n=2 Tax=Bacillus cereus group TaxID=86661 RepID=R8QXA9_BACCE|nr:sensor histidine kinase [Bacillus mycoides]EOP75726.1 sensory histidine kinase DcuS [Bacillus cereus VD118]MBJ8095008.1 two-component system sensor histidine kinase DcuS [Bacillus cereus]MCQ6357058.1 sensor histidine kinase [Bacillus cereus]CAH2463679.1 Signal transduction histidine kinase regulating citrate malate metabolism [Bacillus mycoides KBAB4]
MISPYLFFYSAIRGVINGMKKRRRLWNLWKTITLLVCTVVIFSLLVTDILISHNVERTTEESQAEKAKTIAHIVANDSVVIDGLIGKADTSAIQTYTNRILKNTGVQFIVVMDMDGIRKSHPNPQKIGHHFVGGDEGTVLKGKEHVSLAEGTLGISMRVFVPVFADTGEQLGAVAVGISADNVKERVKESRHIIYIGVGVGLLIGIIGAILLARHIKKSLFGLEPHRIAKILEERNTMLQSVKEGIIAVDKEAKVTLINNEAKRLFKKSGLEEDFIGKDVELYMPNSRIKEVLQTGEVQLNEEQNIYGITIVTNRVPLYVKGEIVGAIATFRDKTEIRKLAEELTGIRLYAEALRAQSHEFMNKMHVVLGLTHMKQYEELQKYVSSMVSEHQYEIGGIMKKIQSPVFAGFLLGKLSYAREKNIKLIIKEDSYLPEIYDERIIHELITIVGNLINNALDAVTNCEKKQVEVGIQYGDTLIITVQDTGKGIKEDEIDALFIKGYSTKGDNRGYGLHLVKESIQRMNGGIYVHSLLGTGTTITIEIPKSRDER